MGFMAKMKSGANKVASRVANKELHNGAGATFLVDKAERYGAAAAFGFLKGYYHEKFTWKGQGYDLWAGLGLLGVSTFMNMASHGNSKPAAHVERFADAGISSYLNSYFTGWGMERSQREVMVLNEGKVVGPKKKQDKVSGDVLGMIPAAMGGSYLTADELAHYAAKR